MINVSSRRRYLPAIILMAAAVAIVVIGLLTRWSRAEELSESAEVQNIRTVGLISPILLSGNVLVLPGRIEAWARAPIHARVSGYLKGWSHDIGESVKSGQVLAEIDTPDLDQELQQARAELVRARSEVALAETTARRWHSLLSSGSVARQEVEERIADHAAKHAAMMALQANVERFQTMQQYRRLTAPFDGVVTSRNTDIGALINVGSSTDRELFVVSDVRRLRIYVSVPQRQVASIRNGTKALLSVPEHPGETFEATVQSLARAIDAGTGAMRVQLTVDNSEGRLMPGGFVNVQFEGAADTQAIGLPPSALIVGRSGVQIALLDDQSRARLRTVTIARDLGHVVEMTDGVEVGDRVINSPPDGIANGDVVRVATASQ
ncbi:RND transporter MFP subunit [Pseudomonas cichorii]|uniref:efflux RND transporter periplasmic adaptor subunit n=1 Tax=Pseudomonas cichorii TaxID=36746 RepID=UPI001910EF4C|nr:efflux RND transporter periplasmic adaptor subunit [Pseudomonas cichorii]GFM84891.1 RND transporter MFP subunit [Pseudomonas cichorii]